MWERLTDRARRVLVLAQEESQVLNHNWIGTEHLLLGLISEDEGVAAIVLKRLHISTESVRDKVLEIMGDDYTVPVTTKKGGMLFTPRAAKCLELSLREALQLGHGYISTEHILLGLIREGEGVAAQTMVSLGAELNIVRQQVIAQLSGYEMRKREPVNLELSPAAADALSAWIHGIEKVFGPFADEHPARLLSSALAEAELKHRKAS